MNKMQQQVLEFHRALTHKVGARPEINDAALRVKLLREECEETCAAFERGDLVEAMDGVCDLIYVALGAAVTCGVDLEPLFDEVHRTNMAKVGGPVRQDGKRLKPADWQPPRIAELLVAQGWCRED